MKMKATSGGGNGGGTFEVPSEDNHRCAIVGVIDLGEQMEAFGSEKPKPKRKFLLAFETLDEMKEDGSPFILGETYTASLHEKAALRKVAEAARGKMADGDEFDMADLLGRVVKLTIEHEAKGEKTYANIVAITAPDKKDRGTKSKTQHVPYAWFSQDGEAYVVHDWLPWKWHRGVSKMLPPQGWHEQSEDIGGGQPVAAGAGSDPIKF